MRSLNLKLVVAFLAVSMVGTLLVVVFMRHTTANEFGEFIFAQDRANLIEQLSDYYEAKGRWDGAESTQLPVDAKEAEGMQIRGGPRVRSALVDGSGRIVVPGLGYAVGDQVPESRLAEGVPIEVDGRVVGTLLAMKHNAFGMPPREESFLARVNQALVKATLWAIALALLLSILLARSLTRPLRELTAATRAMANGDLEQRVPVRSRDELGELASSFNQMNTELIHSRDLRRQMTADIAHDLRTPLSLILGHAEALSDGTLPASDETFHVMYDEALRLKRLVDDLRVLSLSDAGELAMSRRPASPRDLLERAVAVHAMRAQEREVSLELDAPPGLPEIDVDPGRIAQVLDNLLDNALRHTPPNGCVTLSASGAVDMVQIHVQDTGPGLAPEDLPRIFDRLYRGDKSRHRHEGGSGLGLAIAKSIIESHGGCIRAESKPGQGLTLIIELPQSALTSAKE